MCLLLNSVGKRNPLYINDMPRACNQFVFYMLALPKSAERATVEETSHTGNPVASC